MNALFRFALGLANVPDKYTDDLDKSLAPMTRIAAFAKDIEPQLQQAAPHLEALEPLLEQALPHLQALLPIAAQIWPNLKKEWPDIKTVTPTVEEFLDFLQGKAKGP